MCVVWVSPVSLLKLRLSVKGGNFPNSFWGTSRIWSWGVPDKLPKMLIYFSLSLSGTSYTETTNQLTTNCQCEREEERGSVTKAVIVARVIRWQWFCDCLKTTPSGWRGASHGGRGAGREGSWGHQHPTPSVVSHPMSSRHGTRCTAQGKQLSKWINE